VLLVRPRATPLFLFFSRTACELCYYKANAAVFGFVKIFFLFLICISPVDRSTRQEQKHVAVVGSDDIAAWSRALLILSGEQVSVVWRSSIFRLYICEFIIYMRLLAESCVLER